jgi:hypothetical protein
MAWITSTAVSRKIAPEVRRAELAAVRPRSWPTASWCTSVMSAPAPTQYHWTPVKSKTEKTASKLAASTSWLTATTPDTGIARAMNSSFRLALVELTRDAETEREFSTAESMRLITAQKAPARIPQRSVAREKTRIAGSRATPMLVSTGVSEVAESGKGPSAVGTSIGLVGLASSSGPEEEVVVRARHCAEGAEENARSGEVVVEQLEAAEPIEEVHGEAEGGESGCGVAREVADDAEPAERERDRAEPGEHVDDAGITGKARGRAREVTECEGGLGRSGQARDG